MVSVMSLSAPIPPRKAGRRRERCSAEGEKREKWIIGLTCMFDGLLLHLSSRRFE